MSNETTASTSINSSAWQQSSITNANNTSTDTPPDTAVLPVRMKYLFYNYFFFSFVAERLAKSC
jgi:hypothetical protein